MPLLSFFHDISNADGLSWVSKLFSIGFCYFFFNLTLTGSFLTCSIHTPNFATKFRCILKCFCIAVWEFVTFVFISLHTGFPFSSLFILVYVLSFTLSLTPFRLREFDDLYLRFSLKLLQISLCLYSGLCFFHDSEY